MFFNRKSLLAGCAAGSLALAALASTGGTAGAASATKVLHLFQKQDVVTFYNASNLVIQGYPPVGGHVSEDDTDFVGNHAHHAKHSAITDHLYCTVVSAPANATCSQTFAIGGALIYSDNAPLNLAASSGPMAVDGGTGSYSGYTGQVVSTTVGNSNNSDLVITLHKG